MGRPEQVGSHRGRVQGVSPTLCYLRHSDKLVQTLRENLPEPQSCLPTSKHCKVCIVLIKYPEQGY